MKIPYAEQYAINLIQSNPDVFKENARTILLIAQTMMKYQEDCHTFITSNQRLNVFNIETAQGY